MKIQNLRREMRCDKCGILSTHWAMFHDEKKTRKIYCHNCYEERSRLKPAVCWLDEAEQICAKTTNGNDQ